MKKNCHKTALVTILILLCVLLSSIEAYSESLVGGGEWIVNGSTKKSNPNVFQDYIRIASTLLMIIPLIIITVYVLKRKYGIKTGIGIGKKHIQIIDHTPLGVKKSMFLVKVPGRHLLIGVTNDKIELITEVSNEDVVDTGENVNKNEFLSLIKKSYLGKKQR
ncbi:MAG: flagellar biosynthetic protein FliO [Candidatus Scalinduaceae bacterium]